MQIQVLKGMYHIDKARKSRGSAKNSEMDLMPIFLYVFEKALKNGTQVCIIMNS